MKNKLFIAVDFLGSWCFPKKTYFLFFIL